MLAFLDSFLGPFPSFHWISEDCDMFHTYFCPTSHPYSANMLNFRTLYILQARAGLFRPHHINNINQFLIANKAPSFQLPRRLLSTLLLRKEAESPRTRKDPQTTTETEPNAFIIHPSNSSTFAPETLLASLLSRGQHHHHHHHYHHHHQDEPSIISRDEAIELLDGVQLLPVFDFPGAVQAISDVSDRLHKMQQARRRQQQQQQQQQQQKDEEEKEEGVDPDTDTETTDGGGGGGHHQPVLLIIEGLDALAEGVIRTSNPLRGSAVLVPALRTLTHLARTYASFLSVILVNTSGLGGGGFVAHGQPQPQAQSQGQIQDKNGEGIHSVFFRPGMTSPLLPTLLSRSLDQGLDVHLLLSTVRGRRIVEVIKDRVGASVGRWCVWDGNGDG